MYTETLPTAPCKVIDEYLALPFPTGVRPNCPYFNNTYYKKRANLRVRIGKGSPDEIVSEAQLYALQDKLHLSACTDDTLKKFLIDHGLGIDCSGMVTYVFCAWAKSLGFSFTKRLHFPWNTYGPFRRLFVKLRPIENINVHILQNEMNSIPVASTKDIRPGDILTIQQEKRDHVILFHVVERNDQKKIERIHYVHARQWSGAHRHDHGVNQGTITITNHEKNIFEQEWKEGNFLDRPNQTCREAATAINCSIRRMRMFTSP